MIQTLKDADAYLAQFIEKAITTTGKDVTVDRMWPLLSRAGNPQDTLHVVHIAGTSGKTSTAYYCAALLGATGKKVGLTVSPHVETITERLQINGSPVSEVQFCDLLNRFIAVLGDDFDTSYFEFMIVFVLWSFVQLGVDYAVVETGLGGLHDGTNVFKSADKVAVITDIGFDHQHVLGYTISEIAYQKAGIIQNTNHVFMYSQASETMQEINERVKSKSATLHIVAPHNYTDALPLFQKRNWNLAYNVFGYISERDKLLTISTDSIESTKISVPGRMQTIDAGTTRFVLDGAHNIQKMNALVSSFKQEYNDTHVLCILAMKEGKDFEECIPLLRTVVSEVFCCEFKAQQDMPIRSIRATVLQEACQKNGIPATSFNSIYDAVQQVKNKNEPVVLVTGSFYALHEAMRAIES